MSYGSGMSGVGSYAPIALQHVNLTVPHGSLDQAQEFYADVCGFGTDPIPKAQTGVLLWFRVGAGPQQIHVAFERQPGHPGPGSAGDHLSSRHPCFSLASPESLLELQRRIWAHRAKGGPAAAQECDEPGQENSGLKGEEYPTRFFARDYAGNKLEFAVAH